MVGFISSSSDDSHLSDGSDDASPTASYTEGYSHTGDRKGKRLVKKW